MKTISIPDAIKLASKSKHKQHRHAAIIIGPDLKIIHANNDNHYHAEENVIMIGRVQLWDLKNCLLISVAIDKRSKLKLAKPCLMCQLLIKKHKIKNVYYSTKEQRIVRLNVSQRTYKTTRRIR